MTDTNLDTMTLDQLGQQAKLLLEKTAEIAWQLGRIFTIAKGKCQHGQWGKWQRANASHLSAKTIGRYRKVAELPFEEVTGKQLQEVYRILGIIDDADDAEEEEVVETTPSSATTTPLSATTTLVTPEPVEQEEDFGPDAEDHAHIIDDILTGKDLAADDISTEITTAVEARAGKEFLFTLAQNVQRARGNLARQGTPFSKWPPYGLDKKITDISGQHLWTVHLQENKKWLIVNPDGSTVERATAPRKSKSDKIQYVHGRDPKRLKIVRQIFEIYATESITERGIAIRLNKLNLMHYGKPWLRTTICDILRNPAYIGSVRNQKTTQAQYAGHNGSEVVRIRHFCNVGEKQLEVALLQGVIEYIEFVQDIGDRANKKIDVMALARRTLDLDKRGKADFKDKDLKKLIEKHMPGELGVAKHRKFFVAFEEQRVDAAKSHIAKLNADYDRWLTAKVEATTDREKQKNAEKLREIEASLTEWEALAVPLDEQLATVRSRIAEHQRHLADAVKALAGSANLRKAEIVRQFFSAVVLHFAVVQKAKIRDCIFEPDKTEFVNNRSDGSNSRTRQASSLAGPGCSSSAYSR
ncbi:hypothetical protein PX52LOC_01734 [Limnoglobus roseus]|uniref:Recombinase domain-containing protein n=1 Tax=Limnoglobus roseus TaxID=2598579 RepID=A0A5C1A9X7_9BACT|nr:hypothetical protein PX52LOC_01734 [Limnoglobus roseus]